MEAKCGGLAVAAGAAVRRPLQPRDTNVAASTVVVGKAAAASRPKAHPKAVGTRPALPSLPPPPAPLSPVASQCGRVSVAAAGVVAEVSLAEELEKARERRARLRAARERTEREMESRSEMMERAAAEWDRRAEDQRRLVSELMRLIGMPEVSVGPPCAVAFCVCRRLLILLSIFGTFIGRRHGGRCTRQWNH